LIDEAYVAAGAIIGNAEQAFGFGVVLKVRAPDAGERALMKPDATLIGMLNSFQPPLTPKIGAMAVHGLAAFVLEEVARITPAQSIDVLSLQRTLPAILCCLAKPLVAIKISQTSFSANIKSLNTTWTRRREGNEATRDSKA
jgi:hypothetical protein